MFLSNIVHSMSEPPLLLEYVPTFEPAYSYGNLPEHLKNLSIEPFRRKGCQWRMNGLQCGKKWASPYMYYCEEHKDIPDVKCYEPITSCRKRK
jgi:hypothetical protein